MLEPVELLSGRLRLRQWLAADLPAFAAMNADPEVMRYFPSALNRAESDALAARWAELIAERGWGFWAVEHRASAEFIGFVGLHQPVDLPFSPCVETGWRLARHWWGQGLATEAARAALHFGFSELGLPEIVAFTSLLNRRSQAVMIRLGMRNSGRNFHHPRLPAGHALAEHCLYRLAREDWPKVGA